MQQRLDGRGELVRDKDCRDNGVSGVAQDLPLFVGSIKKRHTQICDVDLLIVSGGRVRIIVEIEESGFLPTKICGKFLQSAIATHFIHKSRSEHALPYADDVLFVQVLDDSKWPKNSRKHEQGELIKGQIRSILPLKGSRVTDYSLFFVRGVDDRVGLKLVGDEVRRL